MAFALNLVSFTKKPRLKPSTWHWLVGDVERRAKPFFPLEVTKLGMKAAANDLVACLEDFCKAELEHCVTHKKTRSGWLSIQIPLIQLDVRGDVLANVLR